MGTHRNYSQDSTDAGFGANLLSWLTLETWPEPEPNTEPTANLSVVDMFCGCGGLTLGLWEACRLTGRKLNIRLAVDTSSEALAVFRSNFGCDEKVARAVDAATLIDGKLGKPCTSKERYWKGRTGSVDVLVAGPPCQGHSDLNNSTRRNDPRNALYLTTVRSIEVFQPAAVLIENVPTVVHDKARVVQRAGERLRALGYYVSEACIDVSGLGIPQRRRRHVLTAVKHGSFDAIAFADSLPRVERELAPYISGLEREPSTQTGIYYQSGKMSEANRSRVRYLFDQKRYDLPDRLRPPCHRDKPHTYTSVYGRLRPDRMSQTITSGFGSMGQGRYVHPTQERTITAHEAARIQGFPDFFDFSAARTHTQLRTMIANAVPPQLTAAIVTAWIRTGILGNGHCI